MNPRLSTCSRTIGRLRWVALLAAAGLSAAAAFAGDLFDFEVLQFRAKLLAAKPYEPQPCLIPPSLLSLTYDEHRNIRFRPEQAWWRRENLPFQLQFFHPGFIFNRTVQINELVDGNVTPIKFDPRLFDYGQTPCDRSSIPDTMGFAGFRVHYALNNPGYLDELAVFLGASYFRALGQGMCYGLSARGLALNTGEPGGEEFPVFEEFWVQKPARDAREVVIYALLNSVSVAGAYRFTIQPGPASVMSIRAAVYCRSGVKVLGLAPLTSMFWHGENSPGDHDDFRPEVHDSDGLMVNTGAGEWLWRPLVNPDRIRVAAFADTNPRGFGLVQRDRRFESYEDLEARYHLRPSTWIEPVGPWGSGTVRLVELPTPDETNDNIVAFWVPEHLPPPGEPLEFAYKLHWFMEGAGGRKPPAGYAVGTHIGRSKTHEPELVRFLVDFDGPYLHNQKQDPAIEAVVTVGPGAALVHQDVQKNIFNGTWRAAFALKPDGSGRPVELRCFLRKNPHVLTETWSYLWNP
jgi:glucans biosynthesis protein